MYKARSKQPELVRLVVQPKRDANGRFIQPRETGSERERDEQHNRDRAAHMADYADPWTGLTRTYDPNGRYNCGICNQNDKDDCLAIENLDKVDREAGSCGKYETRCAGDIEIRSKRLTIRQAGYAIAQNGKTFGCHVCPLGEKAFEPDSRGRDIYCMEWECRVLKTACCNSNSTPETKIDDRGQPDVRHKES